MAGASGPLIVERIGAQGTAVYLAHMAMVRYGLELARAFP
jgi:hypothetical protein